MKVNLNMSLQLTSKVSSDADNSVRTFRVHSEHLTKRPIYRFALKPEFKVSIFTIHTQNLTKLSVYNTG